MIITNLGGAMTANYTYRVYLEPLEDGGFNAHIPAFPEVSAEGETEEEALDSAKEGIERVIEYCLGRGMPIPADAEPLVRQITVTVGS
jgi:predicted RNase H-like HicB family nuclease